VKRAGKFVVGAAITTAIAVFGAFQIVSAPSNETIPPPQPDAQNGPCSFVWAYKEAPELTTFVDNAVKALNPESVGRAEYYGEDCIYADGTSTFSAMQTDFYIRLPVEDLNEEEDFGNWVSQVMQIVAQIPREELPGNYGFVEFRFEKTEAEHITFRVPIQQYIDEAQGKTGVELLQMFYTPPQ